MNLAFLLLISTYILSIAPSVVPRGAPMQWALVAYTIAQLALISSVYIEMHAPDYNDSAADFLLPFVIGLPIAVAIAALLARFTIQWLIGLISNSTNKSKKSPQ
jgi:hypothetical protein